MGKPKGGAHYFFSYRSEVVGVAVSALFVFLTFSLTSFHVHDPSLLHFSSDMTDIQNWCGSAGAHVASFFFYLFGSSAYIVLFMLLYAASLILLKKSFRDEWERFCALGILLLTFSTLAALFDIDFNGSYAGGVLGDSLAVVLYSLLDHTGTLLLLFTLLWISLSMLLQYSLLSAAYMVGDASFYWACVGLSTLLASLSQLLFKMKIITNSIKNIDILPIVYPAYKGQVAEATPAPAPTEEAVSYSPTLPEDEQDEGVLAFATAEALAAGDEDIDDSFWQQVQGENVAVATAAPASHEDIMADNEALLAIHARFAAKGAIAVTGTDAFFLNKVFMRLRNSVLPSNIFSEVHKPMWLRIIAARGSRKTTPVPQATQAPPKQPVISYRLPDLSMFEVTRSKAANQNVREEECREQAHCLEEKLHHFGVKGKVTAIRPGPVITLFEYKPEIDTKISRIMALGDDLALALRAMSIRIVAPIPGRSVVGFEIANKLRETVFLSDLLLHDEFSKCDMTLPLALGVDITGNPIIEDLIGMPHLLVAGSTGAGKSVGLNTMLMSLLCKLSPQQLRLILVDPKRLEFAPYKDIPHLLFPIVTNPRKVTPVLKWVVAEMERRYENMAQLGVRNLMDYQKMHAQKQPEDLPEMPFIIIMIDELADLMMVAGKEVELHITRIAQMARAAGIHMIVATQRPSVDVVTGIIKVNFPTRIAFRVSSRVDSKTILDGSGAEKLLGKGDMLFTNPRGGLSRVHGAYVSDEEIHTLTDYLRTQQPSQYLDWEEIESVERASSDDSHEDDELYNQILVEVKKMDEVSISMIQRKFRIGFNRSARLIERLEMSGVIAPAQGSKPRKVLRD